MRTAILTEANQAESSELLTTGEAARILGSSRQHIVDLCNSGDLAFVTTGSHRRILRRDLEAARNRTQRLTRDQRRSIWLNVAVAGKLVADPDLVLGRARQNLAELLQQHRRGLGAHWLREWDRLLGAPVERVVEVLTSPTPWAREMRQNSPFGGVLSDEERSTVLASFMAHSRVHR